MNPDQRASHIVTITAALLQTKAFQPPEKWYAVNTQNQSDHESSIHEAAVVRAIRIVRNIEESLYTINKTSPDAE